MSRFVIFKKEGRKPPMTGEGKGKGMPGGGRRGKNKEPCPEGGPGYGKGGGRGKGKMRKRSDLVREFENLLRTVKVGNAFRDMSLEQKRAFAAGMQLGFQDVLPPVEVFAKVAAAMNIPVETLENVVMEKRAILGALPGILGTGLLTYGGLKGLDMLKGSTPGGKRPHMGMIGGLDPEAQANFSKMVMRSALRNYQLNEMLNQMRAAHPMSFRPVI
jgi:hypothetical protein